MEILKVSLHDFEKNLYMTLTLAADIFMILDCPFSVYGLSQSLSFQN